MKTKMHDVERIRAAARKVATRWPELSTSSFIEEVKATLGYPYPDKSELLGTVWAMNNEGSLAFTNDWRIKIGNK